MVRVMVGWDLWSRLGLHFGMSVLCILTMRRQMFRIFCFGPSFGEAWSTGEIESGLFVLLVWLGFGLVGLALMNLRV